MKKKYKEMRKSRKTAGWESINLISKSTRKQGNFLTWIEGGDKKKDMESACDSMKRIIFIECHI